MDTKVLWAHLTAHHPFPYLHKGEPSSSKRGAIQQSTPVISPPPPKTPRTAMTPRMPAACSSNHPSLRTPATQPSSSSSNQSSRPRNKQGATVLVRNIMHAAGLGPLLEVQRSEEDNVYAEALKGSPGRGYLSLNPCAFPQVCFVIP